MARGYTHIPWKYRGEDFLVAPKGYEGFVYLLTEVATGRKYIGKKTFWSQSKREVKGKMKTVRVESDWQKYYSSNLEIIANVKGGHGDRYTREILHLCKTKGTASYLEAREIFDRRALERDEYLNYYCEVRVNGGHLKLEE